MSPVLAATASGLLGNVGAIIGIVAAIAVALIALLVLGQGQEMKRLRDEAADQAERAAAAEAALAAKDRAVSGVVRTMPKPQSSVAPGASAPPATRAGGAVGTAARPTGSATPSPAIALAAVLSPTGAGSQVAQPAPPAVQVTNEGSVSDVSAEETSAPKGPVVVPAPAAAMASAPAPTRALGAGAPSTAAAGGSGRPPRPPAQPAKRRRSVLPALVATVLVVGAGVFVVTRIGGGSDGGSTTTQSSTSSAVAAGPTVVAVLNGTPVSGLAGQVASTLVSAGFKKGVVTNAPDQQRATTVVAYLPGHKGDAEAVADRLGISANVVPADDNTLAIACPPPAECTADVVVTVGTDRTR